MNSIKEIISGILTFSMLFSLSVPAFAADAESNNSAPFMDLSESDLAEYTAPAPSDTAIIISTDEDLQRLNEQDVQKYEQMLSSIDSNLKNDFETFLSEHQEYNILAEQKTNCSNELKEDVLSAFLSQYPEYESINYSELSHDIELLLENPVVVAVRTFFSSNGYDLALTLFNHSLLDNPADLYYDLIGVNSGLKAHIKNELIRDGFFGLMLSFSRYSTSYGTETIEDYAFDDKDSDMYWAIHRFTWVRTRTMYDKAYFKIQDTYDFESMTIPGIVAGLSGTNDFFVEIYGLVQGGALQ